MFKPNRESLSNISNNDKKEKDCPKVQCVRADGNVLALTLRQLDQDLPLATGEPHFCGECGATMSNMSKPKQENEKVVWAW